MEIQNNKLLKSKYLQNDSLKNLLESIFCTYNGTKTIRFELESKDQTSISTNTVGPTTILLRNLADLN